MIRSLRFGIGIIGVAMCVLCLIDARIPAVAAEEVTQAETLTTIVRLKAHCGAAPIGQIENGTQITVLEKGERYYKIDCYDMEGYVAKEQIVHKEDGEYYVNCDRESGETRQLIYTDHADALALRHSLVALGEKNLGYPYVYGGTRPGGFDCSGLMLYLYGQHEIKLHRTASQQLQDGIVVSREGLQVGDLVFFRQTGSSYPATHVGIYIGDDRMIHSGSKGTQIADLNQDYYVKYYLCARRIVNTHAAQMETVSAIGGFLNINSIGVRTVN